MNFLQLCREVHRECGLSGDGPPSVDGQTGMAARIVAWVANDWEAIQRSRRDWRFLWATASPMTVAGKRDYSYADLGAGDAVSLTRLALLEPAGAVKLYELPLERRFSLLAQAQEGTPRAYIELPNRNIMFDATPDRALQLDVEYQRAPQRLVANADEPLIQADLHAIIVWRAVMSYASFDDAEGLLRAAADRYTQLLARLADSETPAAAWPIGGGIYP